MNPLHFSIAGNFLLGACTLFLLFRERRIVRDAKLATFVEMVGAISYGAAHKDFGVRFERMALALKPMLGNIDISEIRWRLSRAAMIRIMGSNKPALVDVVNGAGRLHILRNVTGSDKADEVWNYIDSMLDESDPSPKTAEVWEVFSGEDLKLAQLQLEAELLRFYDAALRDTKG